MPQIERARYVNPYTDFGFKPIYDEAEIANFTPEEIFTYEESLKVYRDNKNVVDYALDEGIAIGREEGRVEGREEGIEIGREDERIKIARNLKAMGMTAEQIAQGTGLTPEQIEKL